MMSSITLALFGGALIGLSASWMMLAQGRVTGVSGIFGRLLRSSERVSSWRLAFVLGLLAGGALLSVFMPTAIEAPSGRSLPMIALAGGLVGYGTKLGSGCTSGHGVCGLSRTSSRSFVATLTFMATGFLTATLLGLFGGSA